MLYVLDNQYRQNVMTDLQIICGEPTLQFNIGLVDVIVFEDEELNQLGDGMVTFANGEPLESGVGTNLIDFLINSPQWIGIRGESSDFSVMPVVGATLRDWGGTVVYDQYPNPYFIETVYDVIQCDGRGFWVEGTGGNKIDLPTYVGLFHELVHVEDLIKGTFNVNDPEQSAIDRENEFRATFPGLGARISHSGGCYQPKEPKRKKGGCFIATAAYGSPFEAEVQSLRDFRDNILRKTPRGNEIFEKFYKYYYKFAPFIVTLMESNPEIREIVKWGIVHPIVMFLKIAVNFPRADIVNIEDPWKSFLLELRKDLEKAAKWIEIPYNFDKIAKKSSIEEIRIILGYILRKPKSRTNYLRKLEESKQIPVAFSKHEGIKIIERLKNFGMTDAEINRIIKIEESKIKEC